MAAINTYQVRKIYAIAGALGMKSRDGDDALHDLVFGMTGKQHISGLTSAEAYDVIAELEKKQGSNPTPRRRGRPQRPTAPGHASGRAMRQSMAPDVSPERIEPQQSAAGRPAARHYQKGAGHGFRV